MQPCKRQGQTMRRAANKSAATKKESKEPPQRSNTAHSQYKHTMPQLAAWKWDSFLSGRHLSTAISIIIARATWPETARRTRPTEQVRVVVAQEPCSAAVRRPSSSGEPYGFRSQGSDQAPG